MSGLIFTENVTGKWLSEVFQCSIKEKKPKVLIPAFHSFRKIPCSQALYVFPLKYILPFVLLISTDNCLPAFVPRTSELVDMCSIFFHVILGMGNLVEIWVHGGFTRRMQNKWLRMNYKLV